jgi:putative oxidoreductase
MRHVYLLAARVVLGAYMFVHGAQKLFGWFGGPGLDAAGQGFAGMGLTPGKPMAALAGGAELTGGVLTAVGVADPLGSIAITGAMTVASAVHRKAGPFGAKGGFELPLTNLALAVALAGSGPGKLGVGRRLPNRLVFVNGVLAGALTGYSLAKLLRAQAAQEAAAAAAPFDAAPQAEAVPSDATS